MHKNREDQVATKWNRRHLLGIRGMRAEEIRLLLDHAESFREVMTRRIKKVPTLRGRTVVHFFLEPSTRTRTSFEIAAKRLSADIINMTLSSSAMEKGETLADTALNLQAMMSPDVIVIRHKASGVPETISRLVNCSVINAGDGSHEHPTQALLDAMTIRQKKGKIAGLKVVIIGDILHSRVARSDIYALTTLGAKVHVCGPGSMIPVDLEALGVTVHLQVEEAIRGADAIILLRIQLERESGALIPSLREYARQFGLNSDRIRLADPEVIVMHPGPVNRGVEISHDLMDSPHSVILDQVSNGVAVRMAALYLVSSVPKDGGERA